jgi:pimeloyl-ACP methyl ester carboxylesterase
MARVAVPDYVRFGVPSTMALFRALTQYPSLQRLLEMKIPTLVVLGERDPLLPGSHRVNEIASQTDSHVLVVLLEGAAHAINFSHPDQLAHIIRLFMDDRPIVGDESVPGGVKLYEIHRGIHHPPPQAR